jgi:hypothetical protein
MPATDFLTHFRAASLFLHPVHDLGTDPPTAEQLEDARKYSQFWLTPSAVEGFDPDDFYTLSAEEKAALAGRIEQFVSVAAQVPADTAPTPDQVREARDHFLAIRRMVDRYVWDWESLKVIGAVEQLIREGKLPNFVVGADARVGEDSTGDPAVWVWFIVTDEAAADDRIFQSLPLLREHVTQWLDAMGYRRIVYIHFRSLSSIREVLAGVPE